jgi:hypothetical protein
VVWGIQGSGGSVQDIAGVLERVVFPLRVGVWMEVSNLRASRSGCWRLRVGECDRDLREACRPRSRCPVVHDDDRPHLPDRGRWVRSPAQIELAVRVTSRTEYARGRTGFPGHPPSFSFLHVPFAKSLQEIRCALRERKRG